MSIRAFCGLKRWARLRLSLLDALSAAELDSVLDGLGAGPERNAVAQVEDGLAARDAGQGVDEHLEGADHLHHLGEGLLRVWRVELLGEEAGPFLGVVLELLEDLVAVAARQELAGGDRIGGGQRRPEGLAVGGERQEDPAGAVEAHQHDLVLWPQGLLQDPGELGRRVPAARDADPGLVDEDDEVKALLCRLGRSRDGVRGIVRRQWRAVLDAAEVAELDRPAVLEDLEVLAGEILDRPALTIGDVDIEIDYLHFHRGTENWCWRRLGSRKRGRQNQSQRARQNPW